MKKWLTTICAALLTAALAGCAAQYTWETVDDTIPDTPVSAMEGGCRLCIDAPEDASAPAYADSGCLERYAQADGTYEITVQTLLSSELDGVVRRLTGFAPEQIDVLKTQRFGLPEYQFAWVSSGDEGEFLCRAAVICDGDYYYALTFAAKEDCAAELAQTARAVFASMRLNANEYF